MNKRKGLSKKIRFEVFKRDTFKCQYCGSSPPSAILEVDHIEPVSKGGGNDIDNLLTSCFDCNRGKSNNLLSSVPISLVEKSEKDSELEEQLNGIKKVKAAKKRRVNRDVKKIEEVFMDRFSECSFSASFKDSIKLQFLPKLDVMNLVENMEIACLRIDEPESALKYFCGVNWRIIKDDDHEY